jgi:hypothetical protein
MPRPAQLLLLEKPAQDRIGDGVSVHAVFAAPHLLLYLTDPHVAIPFAWRLAVTDQFVSLMSAFKLSTSMPKRGGWTFGRRLPLVKTQNGPQAVAARAGPRGWTPSRRAKMMIRWAAL